jgi:hypothetical protein
LRLRLKADNVCDAGHLFEMRCGIMYGIRTRGLAALKEPDVIARLQRCDDAATEHINQRIERLRERGELKS